MAQRYENLLEQPNKIKRNYYEKEKYYHIIIALLALVALTGQSQTAARNIQINVTFALSKRAV